jgi:hypothetical protein
MRTQQFAGSKWCVPMRFPRVASGESELRLMSRPLYEYSAVQEVLDGAIFAFVMGTDPELFLLIEARTINSTTAWYWAFARFTHIGITARHGNQTVFECQHRRETTTMEYYPLFNAELRPALLGDSN